MCRTSPRAARRRPPPENRIEAYQCGPGQPGRAAPGLRGFFAPAGFAGAATRSPGLGAFQAQALRHLEDGAGMGGGGKSKHGQARTNTDEPDKDGDSDRPCPSVRVRVRPCSSSAPGGQRRPFALKPGLPSPRPPDCGPGGEHFEKEGGFTERLYRVRTARRRTQP